MKTARAVEFEKLTISRLQEILSNTKREHGCWVWLGHKSPKGYGRALLKNKNVPVHRLIYSAVNSVDLKGRVIDHKCLNKSCVNPNHLRDVTARENILFGNSPPAINARRTVCIQGHPLDQKNTYIGPKTGYRNCRKCMRIATVKWLKKKALLSA